MVEWGVGSLGGVAGGCFTYGVLILGEYFLCLSWGYDGGEVQVYMFWVQHHSFTRSLAAWMFFSFVPVHWSLWSLGVVLGHFLVVFVSCMDRGHTRHDASFFFLLSPLPSAPSSSSL